MDDQADGTAPVFADDSGRRARILTWAVRVLCLGVLAATAALVVSLLTGVPLPGLGGLMRDPDLRQPVAGPSLRAAPTDEGLGAGSQQRGSLDGARRVLALPGVNATTATTAAADAAQGRHAAAHQVGQPGAAGRPRSPGTGTASGTAGPPPAGGGGVSSGPGGGHRTHASGPGTNGRGQALLHARLVHPTPSPSAHPTTHPHPTRSHASAGPSTRPVASSAPR